MKKEDLVSQGLTEEQISYVMAENGKDIEKVKAKLTTAETEKESYKEQLATANTEIQSYKDMDVEGVKAKVTEWEAKYLQDTKALQDKLDAQAYTSVLEKFVEGYQFTSELAKKAVVGELKEKGFKLDGSTLLGAKDFMEELKTNNATAFVSDKPTPTVTLPGGAPTGGNKLTLSEVMALKNANPDLDITQYL